MKQETKEMYFIMGGLCAWGMSTIDQSTFKMCFGIPLIALSLYILLKDNTKHE